MRLFIGLFVCFVGISACVGMADERNTFTGALPEGVTVELVGVRHFDARYLDRTPGKPFPWWRPDGTPLADSPDTRRDLGVGGATHQFLMRIAGDPSCNGRAIGPLDRYLSVDLATQKAPGFEKDDLRRFRLRFPSEQKQADVTVALATGQWEVADSWRLGPTWTPYNGLLGSCDRIILRCPEQKDADVVAEVTQVITDRATRLVLFDKDGQWHVSEGEIGGEGVGLVRHIYRYENLDYSQVDRIEFQARPYDYWITFRNVSLAAGYRTQVEVSIKKPGSLLPGSQLPSFDGIEIDLPEETDSRPLLFCFFDL